MRTFRERFQDFILEQDDCGQIAIFNEYASANSYELVYHMEEFNELCGNFEPFQIATMVRFGEFNTNHDYFTFDGRGNLESIESVWRWMDLDEVADWYEDHEKALYDAVGADAWDLYEAEEDEEEDEEDEE